MPKRMIRLKEHAPNLDIYTDPTERIREFSDDSIPQGPYRVRTDRHGFIATGNDDIPAGARELFIVGDSFVESHFAAEDLRFVSQAERALAVSSTPYRVRNAGYSGMTSLHMLGVLATKMPPLLKPRSRLLLVVPQSDVNALSSPGLYWQQTRTVTPFGVPTRELTVMTQDWRDAFTRMLTSVITFAELHGYDFAISAGLFRNGNFDRDAVLRRTYRRNRTTYEAAVEKRKFIISAVRSIASENAIPVFDASGEFLDRPDFFYDLLHLNHAGQAAYSQALTSWISDQWLVCGETVGLTRKQWRARRNGTEGKS